MRPSFSIYDFCSLFLEPDYQKIRIIDIHEDTGSEEVFDGTASDAKFSKYRCCTVESIDAFFEPSDTIVVNICSLPQDFEFESVA